MSTPRLIGLVGRKGSGKTTAAEYLISKGYKEVAFAEPLKRIASIIYGFSYEMLLGDTPDKREKRSSIKDPIWGHTGVEALQYLGTDVMRNNFDKMIWVKIAKRVIQEHMKNGYSVVVSDVRFSNEIEFIKELGGSIVVLYEGDRSIEPISEETLKLISDNRDLAKGLCGDYEIRDFLPEVIDILKQMMGVSEIVDTSDEEIIKLFLMHTHSSEISFQNCIEETDIKIKNTKEGIELFYEQIAEKLGLA